MMKRKHPGGRPPKYDSAEKLQKKIDEYFGMCEQKEKPLTVLGLCVYLDITRETLCEYEKNEKFSDTVKKAKRKIEAWTEEQLYRKEQVAGVIFSLKNNYGWRDRHEFEHSGEMEIVVKKPE